MGSGTILNELRAAAEMLRDNFGISSDVWSLPSINQLTREGQSCQRWNVLNPLAQPKIPYITQKLAGHDGPVVAATDYLKAYSEQLRAFIPTDYYTLGTDGFGRSDTRAKLRDFFEVDRRYIVVAALHGLLQQDQLKAEVVSEAIQTLGIDPEKIDPLLL
jgi:pyruvate dehydrogenase E1 component